jgi:hypothetical protein
MRTKGPRNFGSIYYCYENYFSVNLLAVTDEKHKLIAVFVGCFGKDNDAGFFFWQLSFASRTCIRKNKTTRKKCLPGSTVKVRVLFIFLGDEAFPLTEYLMRPFPRAQRAQLQQRIESDEFNYRLSRDRMVECSFASIVTKFRILGRAIEANV